MIASPSSFDAVCPEGRGSSAPSSLAPAIQVALAPDALLATGAVGRMVGAPLLGILWLYKQLLSPVLHLAGGPSCGCRFFPTCSEYAAAAIRVHGPIVGLFFSVKRLIRCTPLHPGGVDFVPPRNALRPRCVRTVTVRPAP